MIESENAHDEGYDGERDGKWIQYADLANVVAVTYWSSCYIKKIIMLVCKMTGQHRDWRTCYDSEAK